MKQILLRGFLLLFYCLQFTLSYNNFNELKQDMEGRVQRIATALQEIYSDRCKVDTFLCPVKSFNICQGTDERSCLTSFPTGKKCNGITRYSMTSGIRFPNSVASFNLSDQMKFFLCKTAEPQFQNILQGLIKQNDKRYAWFGAASNTGALRVTPGFKYERQKFTESCKNFDPRVRPWYASNIYHRKKMVILIQNSKSIHQQPNRYPSIQKSLKALLKTAEQSDLINIIQFSSQARVFFSENDFKLVTLSEEIKKFNNNPANNQSDFFDSVASNITKSNSSDANYQKAIQLAVQILQNSKDINPELQNCILMFTGFKPTNYSKTNQKQVIDYMTKKQKELDMNFLFFGFGFNLADKEGVMLLSALACEFDGIFIELPDITCESMFLDYAQGYYDYLVQGNQVKGYRWTDFYDDAFGLGTMVTVVRIIYYKEKGVTKIIGVASMDVLISQLTVYKTLQQIHQELSTTQIPFVKNISLCALETIRKNHRCLVPSVSKCPTQPLCQSKISSNDSVIHTSLDSSDVQCCYLQKNSSTGLILGLSIGISGSIILIGLLLYCLIFKSRGKHQLQKTYAQIFQKFKDFDKTRIRSSSQISIIKD